MTADIQDREPHDVYMEAADLGFTHEHRIIDKGLKTQRHNVKFIDVHTHQFYQMTLVNHIEAAERALALALESRQ